MINSSRSKKLDLICSFSGVKHQNNPKVSYISSKIWYSSDVWKLWGISVNLRHVLLGSLFSVYMLNVSLLVSTGKIILSTVQENAEFLKRLLKVQPQAFKPSIPHLVYQYNFYTNYGSKHLSESNPEIIES